MLWVIFFIIMWLIVAAALYTWYYAVQREKKIRALGGG